MEKEFIPYKQALDMQNLGFKEICFGVYDKQTKEFVYNDMTSEDVIDYVPTILTRAPLYQQAFRWFRKKHNLDYTIITNYNTKGVKSYRVGIIILNNNKIDALFLRPDELDKTLFIEFDDYEKAELECLKKLIEIVKANLSGG